MIRMKGKQLREMVESLVLEKGISPPPLRKRYSPPEKKVSPWKSFIKKVESGDSVVIPTRQVAGVINIAVAAGFRVQTNRLGHHPWKWSDPTPGTKSESEVHQTRMWFFKDE